MRKKIILILSLLLTLSFFGIAEASSIKEQSGISESEVLERMGILKGNGEDLQLSESGTRAEGLVILIRLLGKEPDCIEKGLTGSFTDVPPWASPYVGYSEASGLIKGVSPGKFWSNHPLREKEFLTLMLRVLSYSEGKDFTWEKVYPASAFAGLIDKGHPEENPVLTREEVANFMYRALLSKVNGKHYTLYDKLTMDGAIPSQWTFLSNLNIIEKYQKTSDVHRFETGSVTNYLFFPKSVPEATQKRVAEDVRRLYERIIAMTGKPKLSSYFTIYTPPGDEVIENPMLQTLEWMPRIGTSYEQLTHQYFHRYNGWDYGWDYNSEELGELFNEGITRYVSALILAEEDSNLNFSSSEYTMLERYYARYKRTAPFTYTDYANEKSDSDERNFIVYDYGSLVCMELDFQIREASGGQKSLKDLIYSINEKFGSRKGDIDREWLVFWLRDATGKDFSPYFLQTLSSSERFSFDLRFSDADRNGVKDYIDIFKN